MSDIRIVDTPTLLELAAKGEQHGFNRVLDLNVLGGSIDIDGLHVLSMILPFHEQYRPNVDHHRVSVLIKLKDSPIAGTAFMDIADTDWHQLVTAEEYKKVADAATGARQ